MSRATRFVGRQIYLSKRTHFGPVGSGQPWATGGRAEHVAAAMGSPSERTRWSAASASGSGHRNEPRCIVIVLRPFSTHRLARCSAGPS
jgi:hypothetical protein